MTLKSNKAAFSEISEYTDLIVNDTLHILKISNVTMTRFLINGVNLIFLWNAVWIRTILSRVANSILKLV